MSCVQLLPSSGNASFQGRALDILHCVWCMQQYRVSSSFRALFSSRCRRISRHKASHEFFGDIAQGYICQSADDYRRVTTRYLPGFKSVALFISPRKAKGDRRFCLVSPDASFQDQCRSSRAQSALAPHHMPPSLPLLGCARACLKCEVY